ncbi:MAG: hypothetical protein AAF830_06325 [Pseudomonadota bacterium]
MDKEVHLITEQDLHAYIDGELSIERRRAVEAFLAERDLPLERAVRYLRNTFDLRAMKDRIYEEDELKSAIDELLSRRATSNNKTA